MSADWNVEVSMAEDGTYRAKLFGPAREEAKEEVWGYQSIPDALRALADEIEEKGPAPVLEG